MDNTKIGQSGGGGGGEAEDAPGGQEEHRDGAGAADDRHDGAQAGDDQYDRLPHNVEGAQGCGGQPSIGRSRPRKDFRIVKKRGIIPDGLVQRRLDSFVIAFPNLRRGGGQLWMGQTKGGGGGLSGKLVPDESGGHIWTFTIQTKVLSGRFSNILTELCTIYTSM